MLKRSVVLRRKPLRLPKFEYKTIVLFSMFICGVIIGALLIKNSNNDLNKTITSLIGNYIESRKTASFFADFGSTLLLVSSLPVFCFVLGFCAVGVPGVFISPFAAGIVVSTYIGYYYSTFGASGLGYCALVVIPAFSVVVGTLIKCAGKSATMSVDILESVLGQNTKKNDKNKLKDYCANYIVMLLILVLAALLNCGSFRLFGNLFNFI